MTRGAQWIPDHICCDTCPLAPTCEEVREFAAAVGLLVEDWGDDGYEPEPPGAV